MKKILIGHRGTGKSELLKRHQGYFPEIPHFDLDAQIETSAGTAIADFFARHGEAAFRQLEISEFKKLEQQKNSYVIAVGAGFPVEQLPGDALVTFVRRNSDADGRLFQSRPRLEKSLSPLDEYKKRFVERNQRFQISASHIYDMPEGLNSADSVEKNILTGNFRITDAIYTLCVQDLKNLNGLRQNFQQIELRTDLLPLAEIRRLLATFPEQDWLVSIRSADELQAPVIDCDVQFFRADFALPQIISCHDDSISEGVRKLADFKCHLKLCPLVQNFEELIQGYKWQQQAPALRSFLPRSANGRWIWYRQIAKYLQKINFVKNFTDIADQPSIFEWLSLPQQRPKHWAAVLGSPVHFSRSPVFHQKFFSQRNSFFTRIEFLPAEFNKHAGFLTQLGLGYAAVTSPLKQTAFEYSASKEPLGSINTLFLADSISASDTDLAGFAELTRKISPEQSVAIWGGGGTLAMMKSILPRAVFFSARDSRKLTPAHFDYLIWAAPRTAETRFPGDELIVGEVIDLNYTANSMGLEFAISRKIRYTSGLSMFEVQALKQQEFWSANEC